MLCRKLGKEKNAISQTVAASRQVAAPALELIPPRALGCAQVMTAFGHLQDLDCTIPVRCSKLPWKRVRLAVLLVAVLLRPDNMMR